MSWVGDRRLWHGNIVISWRVQLAIFADANVFCEPDINVAASGAGSTGQLPGRSGGVHRMAVASRLADLWPSRRDIKN